MFSSGGKHDGSERNRRFGRRSLITLRTGRELRSDHPLLAIGLKVTYDLRNDADQLAGDVGQILLRQLSLLARGHGTAERRLELRCAELSAPGLRRMAETELAEASELLAEASELTLTEAALHGRIVRLLLALKHSNDLRNDGQDLPHDFIHVLRAQLPRRLAVGCVADSAERILCLREDLRQRRYQLTHDLVHVLLRKLALLAAPLLAPSHRLPARAGVISECAEGLLTAVLPILLAVGRLSESNTALSKTALSKTALRT
jgi:hypothetical protein